MGWLTDLSNVAVGAIERDRQITKEDLAIRAENLQANKAILLKQKEYKWSKELEDYEAEKLKFDKLEAANAIFKIDNNDINYAMAALPLTTPNWDKLTKKMKETQIFNFDGETFDYTLAGTRDEINKKAALEMTAINDIVAKQIKDAKGDSFLIKQILRKKDSAEKNILEDIESKVDAAETINLTERKLKPENVGLKVTVGSGDVTNRKWTAFQESELGKAWMTKFLAEQKDSRFNKITFKDNFNDILKFLDVKKLTSEANFRTDGYDVKIEGVDESSRAMFDTYKDIYFAVWKSVDAKELWAQGVEIQDLAKHVNKTNIQTQIYKIAESRMFSEKIAGYKDKDFMGVVPTSIVPLNKENPNYGIVPNLPVYNDEGKEIDRINLTAPNVVFKSLYEDFIKLEADKLDGKRNLTNLNIVQTGVAKGLEYADKFKLYIAQNWEKKRDELEITATPEKVVNIVDNKGEISLHYSVNGKVVSLTQLKKEGKLEAVLEKYKWIKEDPKYIAWLKTQTQ